MTISTWSKCQIVLFSAALAGFIPSGTLLAAYNAPTIIINSSHSYLPRDVEPVGSLKLCLLPGKERNQFFACRDYRGRDGVYTLLFSGGRIPHAILHRQAPDVPASTEINDERVPWAFDLPKPIAVPMQADHVGTGVCTDAREQFVPCAVFWRQSTQTDEIQSYLIFYDPAGGGPTESEMLEFRNAADADGELGKR